VYLDWYRAVFEEGKRLAPPDNVRAVIQVAAGPSIARVESAAFIVQDYREFDSEIISYEGGITVTQKSIYFAGQRFDKPLTDLKIAITPRLRHLVIAVSENNKVRFRNLTQRQDIDSEFDAEEVMSSNGRIYLRQLDSIFAVDFLETTSGLLPGLRPVANVMMQSTRLFEGVAIQNLLGTHYASIFSTDGYCHQLRLAQLDGYQVLNARLERNVLIMLATRKGLYDRFIFRFDRDFSTYDVRVSNDVSQLDLNFTVLDTGVVLHLVDDNKLEVFSTNKNSTNVRTLQDQLLETEINLFHTGKQALIARGPKLCKISLQQQ
jgi:hypothetical protein